MKIRVLLRIGILILLAFPAWSAKTLSASTLSASDSGWISLFNGKDFSGLYIRLGGALQNPATQGAFKIENGTLHVPTTGGVGAIATKAVYSRYQVRVEYRFGKGQANPNAGLLYHIDPGDFSDPKDSSAFGTRNAEVPYLSGAYVKSVEYQMYRGDAGAFLGIMNVWVTAETKGDANHTWQAGGTAYTAYPSSGLADRRIYRSVNAAPNDTDWVRFDGSIYGGDSVTHAVNGTIVMKGRNLKTNRKLDLTTRTDPEQSPMDRGHIGLQTEGAEVFYRNWEVRPLDTSGHPIIPVGIVRESGVTARARARGRFTGPRGVVAAGRVRIDLESRGGIVERAFTVLGQRIKVDRGTGKRSGHGPGGETQSWVEADGANPGKAGNDAKERE